MPASAPASLASDLEMYRRVVSQMRQEIIENEPKARRDMIAKTQDLYDPGFTAVMTVVSQDAGKALLKRLGRLYECLVRQRISQDAQEKQSQCNSRSNNFFPKTE